MSQAAAAAHCGRGSLFLPRRSRDNATGAFRSDSALFRPWS